MSDQNYEETFTRNKGYINDEQQRKLKESTVAVFGLGGIGGVICEVLARTGIGNFKLIDKDTFEHSNLNRQIFANHDSINAYKTAQTKTALLKINPELQISTYEMVNESNIDAILENVSIVMLALYDPIPVILISRKAKELGIPMVEGWALPYANVRVFTAETPSFEEVYHLPFASKKIADFTPDDETEISLKLYESISQANKIDRYYAKDRMKMLKTRNVPSFAPLVWLTSCFTSIEAVKVLLNVGEVSYAPKMTLYNPFEFKLMHSSFNEEEYESGNRKELLHSN